jgi:hypothetical protein
MKQIVSALEALPWVGHNWNLADASEEDVLAKVLCLLIGGDCSFLMVWVPL